MNRLLNAVERMCNFTLTGPNRLVQTIVTIGNYDFCPWANCHVYWLKQPISWFGVVCLAATLTAVFVEPRAWIMVGSVVAVMLTGTIWP